MALPSSGTLRFSAIQAETESATASLRAMSNIAGFSTPDKVSDFYGYINLSYVGNYAAGNPCNYDYWDIYFGNVDLIYYRYAGSGLYDPMYNYTDIWYEFLYYESRLDVNIYREWQVNSSSTILTDNGNIASAC